MKYQRGGRAATSYIQAVPGENLHAKTSWDKNMEETGPDLCRDFKKN